MPRPTTLGLAICAGLALSGCARIAKSRLNPLNWFGSARPVSAAASGEPLVPADAMAVVADARVPIAQVTDVRVEREARGAIVRATGVADRGGVFNAQLVRRGVENGVLVYDFRVQLPPAAEPAPTVRARTVTVADRLSEGELAGISGVRVRAAGNALQSSR